MLTVILLTVMVTGMMGSQTPYEEMTKLKKHLFRDYNKDIVPKVGADPSQNVTIYFTPGLIQIIDVDRSKDEISMAAVAELSWKDARLSWDPAAYGGVDKLLLPPSLFWVPDIVVYGSLHDSNYFVLERAIKTAARISLSSSGDIHWFPVFCIRVRSKLEDAADGAFKFSLKYGSWTYDGFTVDPRVPPPGKMSTFMYSDNRYEIVDSTVTRVNKFFPGFPEPYPHIEATMTLKKI